MVTIGGILLLFFCFLIVGCSKVTLENQDEEVDPQDTNKATIHAVLEKVFTGPDEEYFRLKKEIEKNSVEASNEESEAEVQQETQEWEELRAYMRESYFPYFTDVGLDTFLNTGPAFQYNAYPFNYQISIDGIEVVRSDSPNTQNIYDFTAQVKFENKTGETSQFDISGMAIFSEIGKIGKISMKTKMLDEFIRK